MHADLTNKRCPDCHGPMMAEAVVAAGPHRSRWWKCTNPRCRTSWLLPLVSIELESLQDQADIVADSFTSNPS